MRVATGDSILGGVAIGPLRFYRRRRDVFSEAPSGLTPEEKETFIGLCEKIRKSLEG